MGENLKILVAIPSVKYGLEQLRFSLNSALFDIDGNVEIVQFIDDPTPKARNSACTMCLEKGLDGVFMADSDMEFHEGIIQKLVYLSDMHRRCGAFSGLYHRRGDGFEPLFYKRKSKWAFKSMPVKVNSGCYEVDGGGAGCMFIPVETIRSIPFPWFMYEYNEEHQFIGEDIYFFEKLYQSKKKFMVDTDCPCIHYGVGSVIPNSNGSNTVKTKVG